MYKGLAIAFTLAVANPVVADTVRVKVDGASLTLILPSGHCRLERGNATDRNVVQTLQRLVAKSGRVLTAFADCSERGAFRARTQIYLDNTGQFMVPLRDRRSKVAPAAFAQQMTEQFKAQGAEILRGAEADTRERLSAMRLKLGIGQMQMLGVLRTDEHASYLGIMQNLKLADGSSKLLVGITAVGLVKERILILNLYSKFAEGPIGAETTVKLLEKAAQTFSATADANQR